MAQLKLNPTPARQFLLALYNSFFSQKQGTAYLEVRGKQEGKGMGFRRFYRCPEDLVKNMPQWQPGLNYWVGVALRRDTRGGKKENLLALTAAFGDVDCGSAGHKHASKYQTKAEALAAFEAFPLRPSLVVDSGGGYQPYWLFHEPVELTPETITRLEGINRGLAMALGGDVTATDAARILRLPGTFNMKLTGKPRPVKVVWCEPERVYDLADFAEYEAKTQGRQRGPQGGTPAPPGGGVAVPGGEYAAYASKALADELAKLSLAGAGERNITLNQAAFSLGQLVAAGVLERESVEAALHAMAVSKGLGENEVRDTIKSGIEGGMKEPRKLPEKTRKGGNGKRQVGSPASPEGGGQAGQGEPEAERIKLLDHTYFVEEGRLCLEKYDRKGMPYAARLANFQARITEEISRDDGLIQSKEFYLEGRLDTGQPLPPAAVLVKDFDGLTWVKREWGARVSVAPSQTLRPHLGNAIQAHSKGLKRRKVYAHTGWQQVGGEWRYLHGGGAIGPGEDVEVDLGENLTNYQLPSPGGLEAAQASLRFLDIGPWEVTAPLLACAFLAPFSDLCRINFSLWLYGPSGSFKSTLSALVLSHFGNFDLRALPISWTSTVNSLEKMCFVLKDALAIIDDFVPPSSSKESQMQMEKASRLIYQVGNRSARGRLDGHLNARPNYYPRCLIISTGELLLPGQRQSATARYLGVELDPEKTPIDKARMTAAQEEAYLYPEAMAAYLADLAPRLDDVREEIQDLFEAYRGAFQGTAHLRIPEIQAWLVVGFEFFLRFQARMGAITEVQQDQMLNRAWGIFTALGKAHARRIEGERPTLKFLGLLGELFSSGRVYAEAIDDTRIAPPRGDLLGWQGSEPKAKNAFLIGWADDATLYFLPGKTYEAVNESIRGQGDFMGFGKNELLAALAREGFIEAGKDGETTKVKWLHGGSRRVVSLARQALGHDEVAEDEGKQSTFL